ncbi:tyrosine-type recombinase/integrase [Plantibacter sp. Mn2098]|uniref:tyrosine-type recombinase/integrase n=1 Tax=Plantibacter sp. Mn2098 TaxID=3395266 RepID=UPI003BCB5CE7
MRAKGTGSIFYSPERGLWTATLELASIGGKRRRRTIRSKDRDVVERKMAAFQKAMKARGELSLVDPTVEEWLHYWMTTTVRPNVRPSTRLGYANIIDKHIIPVIGRTKLDSVTAAQIRRVGTRMTDELRLSQNFSLYTYRVMSAAFEDAVRERFIDFNPARMVRPPRRPHTTVEVLDADEARAVLKRLRQDEVWGARWATSILTGARRGEVIGLEWDRVTDVLDLSWQLQRFPLDHTTTPPRLVAPADFEYRQLRGGLFLTRPKSRAGWRIIPLVDPLKSIIEEQRRSAPPNPFGLVFTDQGRPIDPDRDSRRWRETRADYGVTKNVRLHDLRHTAVDLMYEAGVPEDIIVEILGHSTRAMSRSYKSLGNRPRLEAAMKQYSEQLADEARASSPRCTSCGSAVIAQGRTWRCTSCSMRFVQAPTG